VNGWHNRRVEYASTAMSVIVRPTECSLAEELYDDVFYYSFDNSMKVSILDFFFEQYLNLEERKHAKSLYPNQARDYLVSRIALKDAVRRFIQSRDGGELLFPIEISIQHDEKGKPLLYGHEKLEGIEVSLSHKEKESVAIVSDKPVGIDIEKIEPRGNAFMEMTFTPYELDLLKAKEDKAEWITRFWVAKEAYGKMLGVGLQGDPKQYEIESVSGEDLKIKKTVITTKKHKDEFIIGWTI